MPTITTISKLLAGALLLAVAFEAVRGGKLYFGGYGVGAKGNYLLYLETTVDDYNAHKSDYNKWYESIRLD